MAVGTIIRASDKKTVVAETYPGSGKWARRIGQSGDPCCIKWYIQARWCSAGDGHVAGDLAPYWFEMCRLEDSPGHFTSGIKWESECIGIPQYFKITETSEKIYIQIGLCPITCNPGEQGDGTLELTTSCCICPACTDDNPASTAFILQWNSTQ